MKEPESDEAYKLRRLLEMARDGHVYKISYPPVVEEGKEPVTRPDNYFVKIDAREALDRLEIPSAVSTAGDGRIRHKIDPANLAAAVGGEDKLQPVLEAMQLENTGIRVGGALWQAQHGLRR